MPIALILPYLIIECLAFWGVSQWIGVGWALFALMVFFFGGLFFAAYEMRQIALRLAQGRERAGAAMGDMSLLAAGAFGVALPGFVSTITGLLLILPPTRVLFRKALGKKLRQQVEELGIRAFETTNQYTHRTSYGSFGGGGSSVVIDEPTDADIQQWATNADPEDFGTGGSDGPANNAGPKGR